MFLSWLRQGIQSLNPTPRSSGRKGSRPRRRPSLCRPALEVLEDRTVPSTMAEFTTVTGLLTIRDNGSPTATNDQIRIERVNNDIRVTVNGRAEVKVNGMPQPSVPAANVSQVQVQTGGGNDSITIVGTLANQFTSFTVDGGGDFNTLIVEGTSNVFGQDYTITNSAVTLASGLSVGYSNIGTLRLNADSLPNTITVQSVWPHTRVEINGDGGIDTLVGPDQPFVWWVIQGNNSGELFVPNHFHQLTFNSVERLQGGRLDDIFWFAPTGNLSDGLDGGLAMGTKKDLLSYWGFSSGVTVNLGTGSAHGVAQGTPGRVTGIESALGGDAADTLTGDDNSNYLDGAYGNDIVKGEGGAAILLGRSGDDDLNGGPGHDLLIGGRGMDDLVGSDESDLLIGGFTTHVVEEGYWLSSSTYVLPDDAAYGELALRPILAEWTSSNTYTQRIASIRGGTGATQGYRLDATTVISDYFTDDLRGEGGTDWFWADPMMMVYVYNSKTGRWDPTTVLPDTKDQMGMEVNR